MEDEKLKKAKWVAFTYNILGFVGNILFLFSISSLHTEILMCLIYPLLSIPIMKFSGGLIKFSSDSKQDGSYDISIGFLISLLFLFLISFFAYQIFSYKNLWLIIGIATLVMTTIICLTGLNRLRDNIRLQIIGVFIISLMYCFSGMMIINCEFDNSPPKIYNATVLDHRVETGKHTSYLLMLSKWGPMDERKEEDISKTLYKQVSIGGTVKVYFKKGLFNAPWYQVKLN